MVKPVFNSPDSLPVNSIQAGAFGDKSPDSAKHVFYKEPYQFPGNLNLWLLKQPVAPAQREIDDDGSYAPTRRVFYPLAVRFVCELRRWRRGEAARGQAESIFGPAD